MSSWLAVWKITSATPTVPPLRHLAAGLVAQEAHDLGYLVARLQRDVAAVRDVLAATTSQLGNGLLKGARRSLQRQRIALAAVAPQAAHALFPGHISGRSRSEERRVGKAWFRKFRSRAAADQ